MSRIPGGVSPFSSISSTRRYDVGCGGSECAAEEDAVAASSDGFGDGRSTAEPPGGGPAGVASTRRGVVFNGAADPASDPTAYLGVAVVGGTAYAPYGLSFESPSRGGVVARRGLASSMDRIAASSRRTDAASDSPTTLPGGVPATGAAARGIIIDPVLSRYPPPPREDGDAPAPPPPGAPLALALALRSATAAATASRISSRSSRATDSTARVISGNVPAPAAADASAEVRAAARRDRNDSASLFARSSDVSSSAARALAATKDRWEGSGDAPSSRGFVAEFGPWAFAAFVSRAFASSRDPSSRRAAGPGAL